jgi:hypothetical protein
MSRFVESKVLATLEELEVSRRHFPREGRLSTTVQGSGALEDPNLPLRAAIAAEYGIDELPPISPVIKPKGIFRRRSTGGARDFVRPKADRATSLPLGGKLLRRLSNRAPSPRIDEAKGESRFFAPPTPSAAAQPQAFDVQKAYRISPPPRPRPTAAMMHARMLSKGRHSDVPLPGLHAATATADETETAPAAAESLDAEAEARRARTQAWRDSVDIQVDGDLVTITRRPGYPAPPAGPLVSAAEYTGPRYPFHTRPAHLRPDFSHCRYPSAQSIETDDSPVLECTRIFWGGVDPFQTQTGYIIDPLDTPEQARARRHAAGVFDLDGEDEIEAPSTSETSDSLASSTTVSSQEERDASVTPADAPIFSGVSKAAVAEEESPTVGRRAGRRIGPSGWMLGGEEDEAAGEDRLDDYGPKSIIFDHIEPLCSRTAFA